MRADSVADMGAYPLGAFLPATTAEMLAGVYRIPRIAYRGRSVVTNATPVGAYRGAGRPEAAACGERAMDMLAQELAIDPVELRRENLSPVDAFPFTTATGTTGGSSVAMRAGEVADMARTLAAEMLEVDVADLEGPREGGFRVAGAPDRAVSWAELAATAKDRGSALSAKGVYREPGSTFPFGAHVAGVGGDRETGHVELARHVAVYGCGRLVEPA